MVVPGQIGLAGSVTWPKKEKLEAIMKNNDQDFNEILLSNFKHTPLPTPKKSSKNLDSNKEALKSFIINVLPNLWVSETQVKLTNLTNLTNFT